jgi:predicted MFS family arabinose efflux permease
MATAMAARLVPGDHLGRALTIINAGVSVATVVAVPLGAWLGEIWGWRGVFFLGAGVGLVALIAQMATLPHVIPTAVSGLRALGATLRSGIVIAGLTAILLIFGGHFSGFTYIRPGSGKRLEYRRRWPGCHAPRFRHRQCPRHRPERAHRRPVPPRRGSPVPPPRGRRAC